MSLPTTALGLRHSGDVQTLWWCADTLVMCMLSGAIQYYLHSWFQIHVCKSIQLSIPSAPTYTHTQTHTNTHTHTHTLTHTPKVCTFFSTSTDTAPQPATQGFPQPRATTAAWDVMPPLCACVYMCMCVCVYVCVSMLTVCVIPPLWKQNVTFRSDRCHSKLRRSTSTNHLASPDQLERQWTPQKKRILQQTALEHMASKKHPYPERMKQHRHANFLKPLQE